MGGAKRSRGTAADVLLDRTPPKPSEKTDVSRLPMAARDDGAALVNRSGRPGLLAGAQGAGVARESATSPSDVAGALTLIAP